MAERIFGFRKNEALGQLLLNPVIPEKQRSSYEEGYIKADQAAKTRYAIDVLQGAVINKEGGNLSVELTVALLYSSEKIVTGVAVVVCNEADCFNDGRMIFSGTWWYVTRMRLLVI